MCIIAIALQDLWMVPLDDLTQIFLLDFTKELPESSIYSYDPMN